MDEESQEHTMVGTPPPAMFPARNYSFKIKQDNYIFSVPRAGTYHALDPEFFPEDAGSFNIFDEESKVLYMPAVTKVLFAVNKYPELAPNQFFVPYTFTIGEETVDIVGQVIEIIHYNPEEEKG